MIKQHVALLNTFIQQTGAYIRGRWGGGIHVGEPITGGACKRGTYNRNFTAFHLSQERYYLCIVL